MGIFALGRVVSHAFRASAQENATFYQVMLAVDAMDFVTAGGGPLGYENYFKWGYATWRKSPERIWRQKAFFWDTGLIYDASNPPKEYAYPPHFH